MSFHSISQNNCQTLEQEHINNHDHHNACSHNHNDSGSLTSKATCNDSFAFHTHTSSTSFPPLIIFVLGGPGAGKGTQCELISQRTPEIVHLSAGDLLRKERQRETSPFKDLIENHIKEGLIVPYEITIALLQQAMEENNGNNIKAFLIDGFPRNIEQGEAFERIVRPCDLMILYECPDKELVHRLLKRGETSGRIDDNKEAIEKRFKTFRESTMAVFNHYETKGKLKRIAATGSIEQVFSESNEFIKSLLN